MTISSRTRKLLWGRAGDRCSICRVALSADAESPSDRTAVIGQECHIVGRVTGGPRGDGLAPDRDDYANLILLCPNDHARVDAHPVEWSVGRLRDVKATHEQWVRERLAKCERKPEPFWRSMGTHTTELSEIKSGAQIMRIHGQTLSVSHDLPDRVPDAAREAMGTVLKAAQEWADVWDEVSIDQRLDAQAELDRMLDGLAVEGFIVFGGIQRMTADINGSEVPWPNALLLVRERSVIEGLITGDSDGPDHEVPAP